MPTVEHTGGYPRNKNNEVYARETFFFLALFRTTFESKNHRHFICRCSFLWIALRLNFWLWSVLNNNKCLSCINNAACFVRHNMNLLRFSPTVPMFLSLSLSLSVFSALLFLAVSQHNSMLEIHDKDKRLAHLTV